MGQADMSACCQGYVYQRFSNEGELPPIDLSNFVVKLERDTVILKYTFLNHVCDCNTMNSIIIKTVVRSILILTSRNRARNQAMVISRNYLDLANGLDREIGIRSVRVPPMRGVDEDMRDWSFYMILGHNAIVNRSISATIQELVRGEDLSGAAKIDPKRDVMPSQSAAEEQLGEFKSSVNEHVAIVANLGKLRGTLTAPHPIFGDFDAHMWNCMFSFHLSLHYKQAEHVVRMASANQH